MTTARTDAETGPGPSARSWSIRLLRLMIAISVFCMMATTFVDVVGRYVFNAPLPGAFELVEFFLALTIFSGLPLVTADRGHITVSLFEGLFQRVGRWLQELFVLAFSASVVAFISYQLWHQAESFRVSERATTFLEVEIAPFVYFSCVLSGITALILLAQMIGHLRAGPGKEA